MITRTVDRIGQQIGELGLGTPRRIHYQYTAPVLVEQALVRREGVLSSTGALIVRTGSRTGRSPNDKFVVEREPSRSRIWWGKVNRPIDPERADRLWQRMCEYTQGRDLFVQDLFAGADETCRLPIRVITEWAWHSLFARQLFIRPEPEQLAGHEPQFTVINLPGCLADPAADGTNSEVFVIVDMENRRVMIGGTGYAGETKKSIFTVLNYLLPLRGVLSMHCSANVGAEGDVALFFGLSGTGKTTLSADPQRRLIGDDEHGWTDKGIFNFEGGCYAKCIRLSPELEPQIYNALRFGAVLENVIFDEQTREPDYDDDSITENTRAAYPLHYIDNAQIPSVAGHPRNIVFLTCDAFGVLPPIARLTPEQAMYHFLSGYTAKVAGTEAGITDPVATFSTCFGAPFLPLPPTTYATLLGERIARHKARVWLVNTGWTGGPFGVGRRMPLRHTRAMLSAALAGRLDDAPTREDPIFRLAVPVHVPDVPDEILDPRQTWADPSDYDAKARKLAGMFVENFKAFAEADPAVRDAGPRVD